MLSNLLINAAKYSGSGGEIVLQVELEPEWLRFRVQDNGIGIASEMIERVFEMFTQVESDRARSQLGRVIVSLVSQSDHPQSSNNHPFLSLRFPGFHNFSKQAIIQEWS